ncbi:hypothetical protein PROFUN_04224 [Planoprotostelium fungivorum]|uniref:Uncharacterized protein n=1 Tax=Planoprotostelium fungivorum TaxID=1890364 RepID=A0A2P6NVZ3_9EUKA|nr:hypothetical protein PROFUN_04224 [Planoprotostelium fungivorum]
MKSVVFLLALFCTIYIIDAKRNFSGTSSLPHSFSVVSDLSTKHTYDSMVLRISTDFTPRTTVTYVNMTHTKGDRTGVDLFNRWRLWKLLEFKKGPNATETGYTPSTDTRVSHIKLWKLTWSAFSVISNTSNNITSYQVCSNGNLNDNSKFSVQFCGQFTDTLLPNQALSPDYLKWSLSVTNYPYNSTNSSLALKVSFQTTSTLFSSANPAALRNATRSRPQFSLDLGNSATSAVSTVASWDTSVSLTGGASCPTTAPIAMGTRYQGQATADTDADVNLGDSDVSIDSQMVVAYYSVADGGCQPAGINWDPYTGFEGAAADTAVTTGRGGQVLVSIMMVVLAVISVL